MKPERWQHIKSLLQSALEREPGERAAFLDEACAATPSLRSEVESLIVSYEEATGFIELPAVEVMADSLEDVTDSLLGQSFGPYQILARIGSGGMGEVYLAQDSRLGRKIALKMLPHYFTRDDDRVRRFQQEARAASALNHPNILTIHEIGQIDSRHFIATEFIEGETLRQRMNGTPVKLGEALDIATQAASALMAAHEAGIAHRDIKPENIMLRPDGVVKVLDFGLAKLTDDLEAATLVNTKQGIVMGTAHYMSPEQARGQKIDARSDLFSLGAVLYEMVAGRVPFEGETMTDVLASVLRAEPAALNLSTPAELQRIVDKGLRKDKAARYQTAKELLSDLKDLKQRLEFEIELERSQSPALSSLVGGEKAIDSLAVLPFVNVSADPNVEYLSDGLTESIISNLSQLPNLKVISRSSVFHYKGKETDPQAAGRELRVQAVMTGRVVHHGDDLSISVELVDVQDKRLLWAQQYNRKITDLLTIQEEISREISGKLRLTLTGEEQKRLRKRYTENAEAYQLYLKGRYYIGRINEEGVKRGIEAFKQAIDLDPNYALAYAGLADAYYGLSNLYLPPKEAMPKARALAMKALELDETLAEAHASLAVVKSQYEWEWEAAEREYKRALELNSSVASVHYFYGTYLLAKGRPEEALAELKQAQELDPLSLALAVAAVHPFYYAPPPLRQYDRAIEELRKIIEMDPNFSSAHSLLGGVYVKKEMYEEAVAEHKKAWELGNNLWDLAYLVRTYALAGKRAEAQKALSELQERAKQEHVTPNWMATAYLGLGDQDEALAWLEKAYEERDENMTLLNVDPVLDSLHTDPRFTTLLRHMGLNQAASEMLFDLKNLKQDIEFEAGLGQSEPQTRSSDTVASENRGARVHSVETANKSAAENVDNTAVGSTVSGRLFSAIKGHQRIAVLGLAALVVALGAIAYFGRASRNIGNPPGSGGYSAVAVLPFANASTEPNADYMSDGITEGIINSLSQLPKLRVMARSTVFRYKGKDSDPQKVGRALGVDAVLIGKVTQVDDNLIIQADLVNVADGSQIWGERYSRKLSDILTVQGEIAKSISEKLRLKLTGEEEKQLTKRYTENTEAYQLYLKGRYYWNKRTEEGFNKSLVYFEQAIARDPAYALAYAGLADTYLLLGAGDYSVMAPREAMFKTKAAATKALDIDETISEAHTSLAFLSYIFDWDWAVAEKHYRRAIELNPNYATAHHWYSLYLTAMLRMDEAVAEAQTAQELDPFSLIIKTDFGLVFYRARQYDRAIEQLKKTLEMEPNFATARWNLGRAFLQKKMYPEAIAELRRAMEVSGNNPVYQAALGHALAVSGRKEEAAKILNELKELSKRRYVLPSLIAIIYIGLDDKDQAFAWLEKAYQDRSDFMIILRVEPVLDGLRSDPRFSDLLQRVGHTQ